jgi:hypothetical protein
MVRWCAQLPAPFLSVAAHYASEVVHLAMYSTAVLNQAGAVSGF